MVLLWFVWRIVGFTYFINEIQISFNSNGRGELGWMMLVAYGCGDRGGVWKEIQGCDPFVILIINCIGWIGWIERYWDKGDGSEGVKDVRNKDGWEGWRLWV